MTLANTDLATVLAEYIQNLIIDSKTALGLKEVYFGDQLNIPVTPVGVVMPGTKRRELAGVSGPGGRTLNALTVYIDILSSRVAPQETASKELFQLAEAVESFLHIDVTMGGLVIHGFVQEWDPGIAFMQNGQFRMVRMTWVGQSKTYLSPMVLESQ